LPVFLAVGLLLSACGGEPAPPRETLEERVMARWNLMLERDFETSWEYHSPGFRQMNPRFDFARDMAARPVRWQAAELESIDCDGDVCNVRVRVTYRVPAAPGPLRNLDMERAVDEVWIRVEDDWWFSRN